MYNWSMMAGECVYCAFIGDCKTILVKEIKTANNPFPSFENKQVHILSESVAHSICLFRAALQQNLILFALLNHYFLETICIV